MNPLNTYVQAWSESARGVQDVCGRLGPEGWARPTGCPGWTVHDVLAHLAAIESELAGRGTEAAEVAASSGKVVSRDHTRAGVEARRDRTPEQLLAELAGACEVRTRQLRDLPDDPAAPAPSTPAGIAWDWSTLLRNRAIDMWVHEQDIRRAVDAPGGLDTSGAEVTVRSLAGSMGYVLGKRVAPPAGTSVVWEVSGPVSLVLSFEVDADGRAQRLEAVPAEPTATLRMGTEAFAVLATGRHPRFGVPVELAGDLRLCGSVLSQMAVTP